MKMKSITFDSKDEAEKFRKETCGWMQVFEVDGIILYTVWY